MEEKEIIQILKDNQKEGRPYCWMPKDVRIWIDGHYKECAYLNRRGVWDTSSKHIDSASEIAMTDIFCLLASYRQNIPEWELVEFDIDEFGHFYPFGCDEGEPELFPYHWSEWNKLTSDSNDEENFIFAGLQYPDATTWFMGPSIRFESGGYTSTSYYHDSKLQPATPNKIRFWVRKGTDKSDLMSFG